MLGLKAQVRLRVLKESSYESLESAQLTASLTPRAWSVVTLRVGLYFTPPNPGRVGVSRPITPDHALITPLSGA